ncbi:low molecular weight protein-tyrosine-phosphatase [Poritiphilus flavus]|uniref:protein-tyrosine-phosphatase n=1 Tax=Poritiphilus flavus TaxID=2697053 RepID=A0A6L9EFJ6_9FLAO|nr:low molecular weight protein-tyrosine-phosphatase [Poritiphilus flavus]NAS13362.1 low molecular weight phosphotyrosine protein phosphatase [Poritiphilus flavus]
MQTKVLMVCLGNICRSPLAEGILKSKVKTENVFVDSAGTAGYHVGSSPDRRSVAVARKYGIDISDQYCRRFAAEDFKKFDFIYAMDQNNYRDIVVLARNQEERDKVQLLLDVVASDTREVPDPYYGGAEGFEQVYALIDEACDEIAEMLRAKGK